jgi:hypothetical protein
MEHRYSKRVAAGGKLLIYKKGIPVAIGRITDVSRHGIFVATDYNDVGLHQILEVEFMLRTCDRAERCRFRTIVARRGRDGIGLELEENSDAGYDALRELVNSMSSTRSYELTSMVSNA